MLNSASQSFWKTPHSLWGPVFTFKPKPSSPLLPACAGKVEQMKKRQIPSPAYLSTSVSPPLKQTSGFSSPPVERPRCSNRWTVGLPPRRTEPSFESFNGRPPPSSNSLVFGFVGRMGSNYRVETMRRLLLVGEILGKSTTERTRRRGR